MLSWLRGSHCLMVQTCQVRNVPDVQVLTDVQHGVSLPPGSRLELQVEVKPRSYGIICTLLMLDFGEVT